ncbi:MAG: hypothetical protein HZB26_10450 [Candidatus Hydrogenedentes bacterium]|nr:hypothetical protein [Candidatus Hydrogenedentota bacterium]
MHEYPNIWPQGGIFAFSGVDGPTDAAEPFAAYGVRDGIGWTFPLEPEVTLRAAVGADRLVSIQYPTDYCLSDCWHVTVELHEHRGYVAGGFLDRHSISLVIELERVEGTEFPTLVSDAPGRAANGAEVFAGNGRWIAVATGDASLHRQFGIAVSYASEEDAVRRAQSACRADITDLSSQRLAFTAALEAPQGMAGNRKRTVYKAISVLKAHIQSSGGAMPCRWTSPHRIEIPQPRLWDSSVHALGLKHLSVDLAEDSLRAMFAQPDDSAGEMQADTAPLPAYTPLAAWVLWRHFEAYRRTPFLREMYPKLVRQMNWIEAHRRNETGLYGWKLGEDTAARGIESGMDNSPRFDHATAMTAVDLSSYMAAEYRVLEKMAKWLDNTADAAAWAKRRAEIVELMNEVLWDDEHQFYFDLDEVGDFISVKTASGFLPLHGRVPDRDRAEALRMHLMNPKEFRAPLRVPSVALDEDCFTNNLWRGPSWLQLNLFIYYGLMSYGFFQEAREVAHSSIDEVVRCYLLYGCFYEFYDSSTDRPPFDLPRGKTTGALADFSATAAAFLDLTHEVK